ncbi:MAG TPA: DMT family transporter [Telmatospirillum sp.]|nr:DMT family transporter [Telmatospirillum sp.]
MLVLVTILAAAGWFFSLFAMRGMPPLLFIGARFLLAGLILAILAGPQLVRLDARLILRAIFSGLAMCLHITLWAEAVLRTSNLGVGAFILSLGNIMAPVLGLLLFRIHIKTVTWCSVSIALAGLACLSIKNGLNFSTADLLFLFSALASSLYLNLNSRFVSKIAPLPLAAIQLTAVGILSLGLAAAKAEWDIHLDLEVAAWFLASALIATSLRYFLLVKAQKAAPIGHAALIMNLEPVWTAISAVVLLGTTISGLQLVGCALIFFALLVHHLPWQRDRCVARRDR